MTAFFGQLAIFGEHKYKYSGLHDPAIPSNVPQETDYGWHGEGPAATWEGSVKCGGRTPENVANRYRSKV